jgi:hypothetical protein
MSPPVRPLTPEEDAAVAERSSMDSASLTGGNRRLGPRPLIFAFAVAMPLTFVGNQFGGFRASGWCGC